MPRHTFEATGEARIASRRKTELALRRCVPMDIDDFEREGRAEEKPKSLMEHDVYIEVGDTTFEHYSVILCMASPYFYTMLRSSIKQNNKFTIRLEHVTSKAWESLEPFLQPRAASGFIKLDMGKIYDLLPLFCQFEMSGMVNECDEFCFRLIKKLFVDLINLRLKRTDLHLLLYLIEYLSSMHGQELVGATSKLVGCLAHMLRKHPKLFFNDLVEAMRPYLRRFESLWAALLKKLSVELRGIDKTALLDNPLFVDLVMSCLHGGRRERNRYVRPRSPPLPTQQHGRTFTCFPSSGVLSDQRTSPSPMFIPTFSSDASS